MANRFPLIFNSGAGQIQELAASDNLDLTSSNLVNAGILFTSSGSATAPSLQIGSGTTYNPGLYSPGTDQLAISTSGTGWVFVDASGNVGVGTASPAAKLDVNGKTIVSNEGANPLNLYKYGTSSPSILMYGANGTAASPTQTLTGDVIAGLNAFGRGSSDWAGGPSVRITAIATENNGGTSNRGADIKFETVATGGTSLQERLRITSAGLLGLGNSSPNYNLHVAGTARFTGNTYIDGELLVLNNFGITAGSRLYLDGISNTYLSEISSDTINFVTAGSERLRLDSSGRLLVGTSTARANFYNSTISALFQQEGATSAGDPASRFMSFTYGKGNNDSGVFVFAKHRATTVGGQTVVVNGDSLGELNFQGSDGTEFVQAASIRAEVDGTPGANDMPGRLVFSTTADGASSPTERMRIDSAGTTTLTSATSTAPFIAKISSTEVARIDSSGRLLIGTTTTSTTTNTKLVIQQNNAPRSTGGPEAGLFLTTSSTGYALQAGAYDSGSLATSYTWISSVRSHDAYYDGPALPPLVFLIADQECMRITQQKELLIGTSTRNANGGVLQLKSGITFPATAVAASDANTLDDYEQGAWTPGQGTGVTVVGAFSSVGSYTKIGNTVIYAGYIVGATSIAFDPAGGNLVNGGLPFSVLSGIGCGVAAASAATSIIAYGSGTGLEGSASIGAVGVIYFSGSYIVN